MNANDCCGGRRASNERTARSSFTSPFFSAAGGAAAPGGAEPGGLAAIPGAPRTRIQAMSSRFLLSHRRTVHCRFSGRANQGRPRRYKTRFSPSKHLIRTEMARAITLSSALVAVASHVSLLCTEQVGNSTSSRSRAPWIDLCSPAKRRTAALGQTLSGFGSSARVREVRLSRYVALTLHECCKVQAFTANSRSYGSITAQRQM